MCTAHATRPCMWGYTPPRVAAGSNSRPQPGAKTFGGLEGEGGGRVWNSNRPPPLTPPPLSTAAELRALPLLLLGGGGLGGDTASIGYQGSPI